MERSSEFEKENFVLLRKALPTRHPTALFSKPCGDDSNFFSLSNVIVLKLNDIAVKNKKELTRREREREMILSLRFH